MQWVIPGTTLPVTAPDADRIENQFRSMFLAGGIVLSQVSTVTGLEAYTVQNWVKRGFLSKPERKRYSLRQLCRIININMLKSALSLDQICGLLAYINGALDDEADDLIDDAELYFLFIRLAVLCKDHSVADTDSLICQVMEQYQEPVPGAGERVRDVLRIMITAWGASQLQQQAENMIRALQ